MLNPFKLQHLAQTCPIRYPSVCILSEISQNVRETTFFSLMMLSDVLCQHMGFWQFQNAEWSTNKQYEVENVVDSVLKEIVVDGHHGVLLPVWTSPSFSCLTPVQRVYREVSEWELRVRKSGKLPLALPQRRDFPLLRPRVSVCFSQTKYWASKLKPPFPTNGFPYFSIFKNQMIGLI